MLSPGDRRPDHVHVWPVPAEGPRPLGEALGDGPVLLLFYLLDWSFT